MIRTIDKQIRFNLGNDKYYQDKINMLLHMVVNHKLFFYFEALLIIVNVLSL